MTEEQFGGESRGDLEEIVESAEGVGEDRSAEEVESIQAELAQLRRQVDEHQIADRARQHRGRSWAVGLLIVFGVILMAMANLTFWVRGTVLNTDRWVAAVGPLSQNETVANAVSSYLVANLFELVNVEPLVAQTLPPEFGFLSGSLTRAVQHLAQQLGTSLVQSDQFNAVWVGVNRAAHQVAMAVLRDGGDLLYLKDGQLTVDLSDAFAFLTGALNLRDLQALGDIQTQFVILESPQVAMIQQTLALIDGVGLIVPLLALALLFLAWLISLWRRRTVLWIGIGIAVAMALSLVVFALIQPAVVGMISDPFVRLLAGEILTVVTRGLYIQTIIVLIAGLLLVLGSWLAGPGERAVAVRTGFRSGWRRLGKRQDPIDSTD